jgi:hypothetical protein
MTAMPVSKRISTILAVVTVGASFAAPVAADAAVWARISQANDTSNQPSASMMLRGATVVAAFDRASTSAQETAVFTPSVAQGAVGITHANATPGWSQALDDPQLLASAGGGLQMITDGSHSTTTGDPLNGVLFFPVTNTGTPGVPVPAGVSDSITGAVLGPDATTPFYVGSDGGVLTIYRGAAMPMTNVVPMPGGPGGDAYRPQIGVDRSGRIWVAWYELPAGAVPQDSGLWIQQVDPATGAATGPQYHAPQSSSISNEPPGFACYTICRIVYHQSGTSDLNTGKLVSWAPGDGAVTIVVNVGSSTISGNSSTAASYDASGNLWVAWYQSTGVGDYRAKRGDGRGAGGSVEDLGSPPLPTPTGGGGYSVSAIAYSDKLVVVANWFQANISNMWAATAPSPSSPITSGISNPVVVTDPNGRVAAPGVITNATLGKNRCVLVAVQAYRAATLSVEILTGKAGAGGKLVGLPASSTFHAAGVRRLCVKLTVQRHGFYVKRHSFHLFFRVHLPGRKHDTTHSRNVVIIVK